MYKSSHWIGAALAVATLISTAAAAQTTPPEAPAANPRVRLETTLGALTLELDSTAAPETVANFLGYVDEQFYDGTIFHRVIDGFMIQGGGFGPDMKQKRTRPPIRNEAANGLENRSGTVAMARTSDPHSATAQFFINVIDNEFLDHRAPDARGWGYAVFGKVVEGFEVLERIRQVPTATVGGFRDVPRDPVVLESARRVLPVPQ